MNITDWSAIISVGIALILGIISVLNFIIERYRNIELKMPVFIIEKVQTFNGGKVILLIRNTNDNYFIIKKAYSDNNQIEVNYKGVYTVEVEKQRLGNQNRSTYKGHAVEIIPYNNKKQLCSIFISGINLNGRKFIVKSPDIGLVKGKVANTAIQDCYLEFVKK